MKFRAFFQKGLDFFLEFGIINIAVQYMGSGYIAVLCKGSTADSDSVCLGSNPSTAAIAPVNGALFSRCGSVW